MITNFNDAINKVSHYALKELNVKTQFNYNMDRNDFLNFTNKGSYISIHADYENEEKLFILLHEVGHAILLKNTLKPLRLNAFNVSVRYGWNFRLTKNRKKFVAKLVEEINAWQAGLKLAKKLKIMHLINVDKFINYSYKCLWSYIE